MVTVKNLIEEGFNVTGFERSGYVGGLWHYTDDETTLSVLQGMIQKLRYSPLWLAGNIAKYLEMKPSRYSSKCYH